MPKDTSHNEIWSRLLAGKKEVLPDLYARYYLDFMIPLTETDPDVKQNTGH
jgi:hypothetical protein